MHTAIPRNRLRELLKREGLGQMDIAIACGVYPTTVSRWQDGLIPQQHLGAVAQRLDVSVPYLAGWSDVEEPYSEPNAREEKAA